MNLTEIGVLCLILLCILLSLKMPVGVCTLLVGFIGLTVIRGIESGFTMVVVIPLRWASTYMMSAIPLFIIMGYFAASTGLTRDAFIVANKWLGHLRGGLAISTIVGCAIFGAVCGDVSSATITTCTVTLPEMRRYKYDDRLSLGCIAGGANLSWLIPPSIGFMLYGVLTEVSIGKLFMAGLMPGILLTVLFIITIILWCNFDRSLANIAPKANWSDRAKSLRYLWGFVILIVLVLGGIYGGVFTPTEAAAVGAVATVIIGLIRKSLSWKGTLDSFKITMHTIGMVFLLLFGAVTFSSFMTAVEIPMRLAEFIAQLSLSPYIILMIVLFAFIVIGLFLDIMAVTIIVMPILHPVLVSLGFDPLLVAVAIMMTNIMGSISPPFGMLVFVLAGVVKDVPMTTIFRGALPFFGAMGVAVVIVIVFPQIALWLPSLMR